MLRSTVKRMNKPGRRPTLRVLPMFAAAAVLAASCPSFAGALTQENLIAPLPAGFHVGKQGDAGPMMLAEFIPVGETVQDWSRMVTVQVFHNLHGVDPDGFAEGVKTRWLAACAGSDVRKVKDGVENGYRFSLWIFACPLNTGTGRPENMFTKITSGADSLYSVQYAYRSALTPDLIPPAMQYLRTVLVCDTRLPDRPCPPGM
jgi:hypothetical protein